MRLRLVTRAVQGYAIAALAVGLASCLTLAVVHLYTFIPLNVARGLVSLGFMSAVLAAAWWGGYGPGILATVSTILFAPFLAIRGYTVGQANFAQLGLVLLISVLVSRVAASRDKAEADLRRANEMLDERVQERTAELLRANESLQQREAMLLKQAEELGRSNVDLQQFAYIASHDLQEPLRMISIYTELIERGYHGRLDHEADTFIGVVRDSVRRMDNLIRDLLSYSRAIYPEGVVPDAFEAEDAVDTAIANLEAAIEESHAVIERGELPKVAYNRAQLTQIFQNLIGNSLKYRTGTPRIAISAERDGEDWILSVKDNGLGIGSEFHEAIFDPFKRLHGRDYPGTGVGLAICRRIVERHGGRIWVESGEGMGATFRFTVPSETKAAVAAGIGSS
jgi:light-regulated signal transduction histidine kinase (bacteriophytochrome)